jgi:predicted acetyltransferase
VIHLIAPSMDLAKDFRDLAVEHLNSGDTRYQDALGDIPAFIQHCSDDSLGHDLIPGKVPQSTFWLVQARSRILGCCRIRHALTPALQVDGGHIGYDIRPSERGKGYGTQLLNLALSKARDVGLRQVLLICDTTNGASRRIIEKNGGVFHSEVTSPQTGELVRRYWIDL